uniref:Uncharacterized protein n=2 Tax=Salix viminalis TaxID=40686 RepID=A0A6N2N4V7_SALVM
MGRSCRENEMREEMQMRKLITEATFTLKIPSIYNNGGGRANKNVNRGTRGENKGEEQHQLLFSIVRNPHWQQLQSSQPRPPIVEATLFSSSLPLATTTSHSFLHCEQTLAATNFLSSMKRRQHQHCFLSTIHDSSNNTSSPPSSEATTTAVPQSLHHQLEVQEILTRKSLLQMLNIITIFRPRLLLEIMVRLARASSNEAMLPLTREGKCFYPEPAEEKNGAIAEEISTNRNARATKKS